MANDSWRTPGYIWEPLNDIFNFDCDVAASAVNARCEKFYAEENSALNHSAVWGKMNWCNPPYSRGGTEPFVDAAIWWASVGHRSVMLPKCDPSTAALKKTWGQGGHYFYYSRIKFMGADSCANFPSCLVFFGALKSWEIRALQELGQGKYTAE